MKWGVEARQCPSWSCVGPGVKGRGGQKQVVAVALLEDSGSGPRVCRRNNVSTNSEDRPLTKRPQTNLSDTAREGGRRGRRVDR